MVSYSTGEMVSYSTVNCTVSQQYSCQHDVLLCALWSVLHVGESGGHQVVVGQLPTHMGCCGYKLTLNGYGRCKLCLLYS